ncbi:MAG: DUF1801 domain-containing protein [Bacteroidetes bacterium]|nr:DUF1801 domain-containing protein [Bacteroidota bacterium]
MEHGPLDQFYLSAEEPLQSALLALRTILLGYNEHMCQSLKWGVPTFFYKGTMACYLWKNVKKNELPYIGFNHGPLLSHPQLEKEGRKLIKVLRYRPDDDLPVKAIKEVLQQMIAVKENKMSPKR